MPTTERRGSERYDEAVAVAGSGLTGRQGSPGRHPDAALFQPGRGTPNLCYCHLWGGDPRTGTILQAGWGQRGPRCEREPYTRAG